MDSGPYLDLDLYIHVTKVESILWLSPCLDFISEQHAESLQNVKNAGSTSYGFFFN